MTMPRGMLYRKCSDCGQVKPVFPHSRECRECYNRNDYHERKVALAAVSPSIAMGYVTGTLKGVELLKDCGMLSPLKCAAWSEELLGLSAHLQTQLNSDDETRALIDAQRDAVEEVLKHELSTGAIEAESLEEAKKVFEAKDAELQRQQQEREQARLEEMERDKAARAKLAESAGRARQAAAAAKKAFVTGEKKEEDAA